MSMSRTNVKSQASTYSIKGQKSEKLPDNLPIQIYVVGDDLFSKALSAQLSKRLEAIPRFSQVAVLSSPQKTATNPFC